MRFHRRRFFSLCARGLMACAVKDLFYITNFAHDYAIAVRRNRTIFENIRMWNLLISVRCENREIGENLYRFKPQDAVFLLVSQQRLWHNNDKPGFSLQWKLFTILALWKTLLNKEWVFTIQTISKTANIVLCTIQQQWHLRRKGKKGMVNSLFCYFQWKCTALSEEDFPFLQKAKCCRNGKSTAPIQHPLQAREGKLLAKPTENCFTVV